MIGINITYKFIGERLCLDFCNTGEDRVENYVGELLGSYDALLNWSLQAGLLTEDQANALQQLGAEHPTDADRVYRTAITLREALFRLFSPETELDIPAPNDLAILNEVLGETLGQRRLQHTEAGFGWTWKYRERDLAQMLGPIAHSATELLVSPALSHVRQCGNGNCSWLFLDLSRNHSRRWCTMDGCGNRVKARRFRKREQ